MQDRRDTNCLTDLLQTGTAIYMSRFRCKQSGLTASHGGTAGGETDDIVLDQFFNQFQMCLVMYGTGVITANQSGDAADAAINYIIIERCIGTAK